jgi:hypothetical protein
LVSESARQDIPDEFHDGMLKTTGSSSSNDVELMKDNVVLNKDPTLVFHEKLSLESSLGATDLNGKLTHEVSQDGPPNKLTSSGQESRKSDGKYVEDESKDGSSLEDGDAFSFQAGGQNINFQKVIILCTSF